MPITRLTHQRTLNALEATALELALMSTPFSNENNDPVELVLGEESGKPFVAIGRGGKSVKIHFEQEVEA